MVGKKKKLSKKHKENISKSNKGKHYSPETEFKKGHKVSVKMRKKISIKTKEAMRNPLIRKKISIMVNKRMTKKERKRLATLGMGRKCSNKQKKYMSRIMKGRATKWLLGKPSLTKGKHFQTKESKIKIRTSPQKHHIDLNKQNNKTINILYLPLTIHQYLHRWAYRYVIERNLINDYYKWFENKLKINLRKISKKLKNNRV